MDKLNELKTEIYYIHHLMNSKGMTVPLDDIDTYEKARSHKIQCLMQLKHSK